MLPYLIAGVIGYGISKLFDDKKAPKYTDGGYLNNFVLYHGTGNAKKVIEALKDGSFIFHKSAGVEEGIYLTPNKKIALDYANYTKGEDIGVLEVRFNEIPNFKKYNNAKEQYEDEIKYDQFSIRNSLEKYIQDLIAQGYDGVSTGDVYLLFKEKIDLIDINKISLVNNYSNGGLIAPNGKPSNLTPEQYKLVRTKAFKDWFGDWENSPETASKVVDENGEPLVVYHGTKEKFTIFKDEGVVAKTMGKSVGFYFTPSKWSASRRSIDGDYIEVFLNIKKLFKLKKFSNDEDFIKILGNELKEAIGLPERAETYWYLKNGSGYDGREEYNVGSVVKELSLKKGIEGYYFLEFMSYDEGVVPVYQVFESKNVKLADGTNTTFDGNNPDIRFNGGGLVDFTFEKLPDDYKDFYQIRAYKNIGGERYYFSRLNTHAEKDVFTIETKEGKEISRATLNETENYLINIRVNENYRRKGLGLNLYNFIEYVTGKKLKPSPIKISQQAKGLWNKRNPDIRFMAGGITQPRDLTQIVNYQNIYKGADYYSYSDNLEKQEKADRWFDLFITNQKERQLTAQEFSEFMQLSNELAWEDLD